MMMMNNDDDDDGDIIDDGMSPMMMIIRGGYPSRHGPSHCLFNSFPTPPSFPSPSQLS